jgi:hypothetical protein
MKLQKRSVGAVAANSRQPPDDSRNEGGNQTRLFSMSKEPEILSL